MSTPTQPTAAEQAPSVGSFVVHWTNVLDRSDPGARQTVPTRSYVHHHMVMEQPPDDTSQATADDLRAVPDALRLGSVPHAATAEAGAVIETPEG